MTEQDQEPELKKGWMFECKNLECARESLVLIRFESKRSPDFCPFCGASPNRVAIDINLLMGME